MKSRGEKALINTAVFGLYQVVYFICGLILPRYVLSYFGSDYNGVVSSITQFLNFITILQFGIAGSTRFALYKVLADKDVNGISGIVNATEKYMRKIGLILLAYIGVLAFVYPYIASTSLPALETGLLVLIVGASSFSQYFFGVTYQILLTADQRLYVYHAIATIATALNTVIAVAMMKTGQNIFIVKTGSAVIFILVPVLLSLYVRKTYKIDKAVPPNKTGLNGRWDVMWHSIANIIHENTDLVVLTVFADTRTVSVYTVYYLVINGLYKILSIFTSSLEGAFGNMFAKKEKETAYRNFEFYEFFMCMFVSVVFSCALVLIVPFVKIYTKEINDVNYIEPLFAAVAVTAQMVMCLRQPYLTVVRAAGHYKQTKNGAIVEAGLNIVLSVVLTRLLGIAGVAIGTLAANIFRTLQFAFYLKKSILNRPLKKPMFMMILTAFNVAMVCLISQKIFSFIFIDSWRTWVLAGIICFTVSCVITGLTAVVCCREKLVLTIDVIKRIVVIKQKNRGGKQT